jgi:3-oxoacyl-[acyl-carrier-protein] synthase II
MFSGKSGVRNIRGLEVPMDFPIPYAANLLVNPAPRSSFAGKLHSLSRSSRTSLRITELLLAQIPFDLNLDAMLWASGEGANFDLVEQSLAPGGLSPNELPQLFSENSLTLVERLLRAEKNTRVSPESLISSNNACVSSNAMLGQAMQRIRSGEWNCVIVGAVNLRSAPFDMLSLNLLRALTSKEVPPEQASCPFSLRRAGYVKAEAGCIFLLEERAQAEKRNANVLGNIAGFGHVSDANRLTNGSEDASSATKAMQVAIADAGINSEEISYINAHGTSTVMNDLLETKAIKQTFGKKAYEIPVSSLKSQIGHASIASGAIEAIASMLMLLEQRAAPTINYDEPDPDCDLDYIPNISRAMKLNYILSNSFGFGGQNACLVLKKV